MTNVTEKPDNRASRFSAFGIALGLIERTAKVFTVFVGTIYVIGYIVTATRLAEYGVSATTLIDAQYLVAGLLPGLLLWATLLVSFSAFSHKWTPTSFGESHKGDWSLKWVGVSLVILFVVAMATEFFVLPFNWSDFRHSLLNCFYIAAKFTLGQLAIWFLIVGWRTKHFTRLGSVFRAKGEASPVWILTILCVVLVAITLYNIPTLGWMAYNGLPQSYGGGKPLRIELYVDGNKVPTELLAPQLGTNQGLPARTIPLKLLLKTSAEYIVGPQDGSGRIWVLKTDAVRAEYIVAAVSP